MPGKPCTTKILREWEEIAMPRKPNTFEPSDISSTFFENPEDSILLVADSSQRCQHFVVYVDDRRVGVTDGEGALDASRCGPPEVCMNENGGSHGYFKLAKGKISCIKTIEDFHANL